MKRAESTGTAGRSVRASRQGPKPTEKPVATDPVGSLEEQLAAAHEQQLAISEVLSAIAGTRSDSHAVFDVILRRAVDLCHAQRAVLRQRDGDFGVIVAAHGAEDHVIGSRMPIAEVIPGSRLVAMDLDVVHVPDIEGDPEFSTAPSVMQGYFRAQTALGVAVRIDGVIWGWISLYRQVLRPFEDWEIELVRTFATQAALAIKNVRLFNETKEALEQQTAIAEILRVISASLTDVQPVLDAVAENAVRFCGAEDATVMIREGDRLHFRAHRGPLPTEPGLTFPLDGTTMNGRAFIEARVVQTTDIQADAAEFPRGAEIARTRGMRAGVVAPLLREGTPIGTITLGKSEARPFTDHQIELLKTFAAQAVIAIENVRLFNETKEALERQTAISEILRVISSSPTDVQPVLDAIAENATRFCRAEDAVVGLIQDGQFHALAHHGPIPEPVGPVFAIDRRSLTGRAILDSEVMHTADMETLPEAEFALGKARARELGYRAFVAAPLIKDGKAIGSVSLRRRDPIAFTDAQISLLRTFADQAVIAIENVRLFNETKEALEQQTATADVLKTISRSTFELQPILDTLTRRAHELCGADSASIRLKEGDLYKVASDEGIHAPFEIGRALPPSTRTLTGRVALAKRPVQIADIRNDPDYDPSSITPGSETRTLLGVPLVRDGDVIGVMLVRRNEMRPFSERQVELVQTFANQAVIAIENVRLFNETKEALEQQTAVAQVLDVISRSPHDVQPVLDAVIRSAVQLTGADNGSITQRDGDFWRPAAMAGHYVDEDEFRKTVSQYRLTPGRETVTGRVLLLKRVVQVEDQLADPELVPPHVVSAEGTRTILGVPLLKGGDVVGQIILRRREVRPFTARQISLIETFADQVAIAIENVRLFNETKEALEQQTATAEILRVIAGSPTDVQPVLKAIAESAADLCAAEDAAIGLLEGDMWSIWAHHGPVELLPDSTSPVGDQFVSGHAMLERRTIRVDDLQSDVGRNRYPGGARVSPTTRAIMATPLLRQEKAIGAIFVRRSEALPFTDRHAALIEAFASQAVIAIENVRLFNETKEALERQTAVAGILRAISESPTDVQPVLDAIAESAARFCAAEDATVLLVDGDKLRTRAHHGPIALRTQLAMEFPLTRGTVTGRSIIDAGTLQVPDLLAEPDDEYPIGKEQARLMGHRTTLASPLMREGVAVGAILLRRMEVRPFTEHQQDLVRTFADQAVIAIENVRLFNETKDALARQTAVSEVLGTISRSVFDLEPILTTVIQNAVRLCSAKGGLIFRRHGDDYRLEAVHGGHPAFVEYFKDRVLHPGRQAVTMRAVAVGEPVQIADVLADPEYEHTEALQFEPFRTVLGIPLLHQGKPIGAMSLWRNEVREFTAAEIELVRTFADQAAIAIENVRLFNETKEALEQQTATAEVLKSIGRSAFDLPQILGSVVESATRLSLADFGYIYRRSHDGYRLVARQGRVPVTVYERFDIAHPSTPIARAFLQRQTIHLLDVRADPEFRALETDPDRPLRELYERVQAGGVRSELAVPLLREGEILGVIGLGRYEVRGFTDRQISLVESFADQAAIAIENVRLFNDIQDKSKQLEVASRHKSEFLANMSHELRTPLNAIIGFTDVMLEEMFGPLNEKQKDYLEDVRGSGNHLLTLINDILDLSKIEAGRVELEIGEFSFPDALENALTLVRERAARHGITLASEVASDVGTITADERKMKQILVNLLSNAVKFTPDGGWVSVSARRANGEIEVGVRDTGIGVAPGDQERIFDEFQQVGRDPERSREGTGLGLTLAKRFVELHGGRIWVDSEVGKGSTFTFAIPVRQTALADAAAGEGKR